MNWQTGCTVFFIITVIVSTYGHSHEHDHSHVPVKFFDTILQELNSDYMYIQNVKNLLNKLQFLNCEGNLPLNFTDCHKCLTAEDLYKFNKISTSDHLTEDVFTKMAKVLVYFLTPEKNSGPIASRDVCTEKINQFVPSSLNSLNFSSNGAYVTEKDLVNVLTAVKKDHRVSTGVECFSSHDIFHQIGVQHEDIYGTLVLSEEQFDAACLAIILNLIQGKCIITTNPHHDHLPPRDYFIKYLYSKFGHDGYIQLEQLEDLLTAVGVGYHEKNSLPDSHKHRRSISEKVQEPLSKHRTARNVEHHGDDDDHDDDDHEFNKTCFSTEQLLDIYSVNHGVGVTMSEFKDICPAVIQQLYSGVCSTKATPSREFLYSSAQVWGYGLLAVTIISMLSIVGISVIPVMRKTLYKKVLAFLVAFAVGTLAGDGIMHLLPHALKLHDHSGDGDETDLWDWYWKLIVVLGGIYGFYLFETIMHFVIERKQKGHIEHTRSHNTDVGSTCRMMENHEMTSTNLNQMYQNLADSCHKHHHHHHHNIHEVHLEPIHVASSDDDEHDDKPQNHPPFGRKSHAKYGHQHRSDKHNGHSHQPDCGHDNHAGHSHQPDCGHDSHAGHSHQPNLGHDSHAGHSHQPNHGHDSHAGHSHHPDSGHNSHAGHSHQPNRGHESHVGHSHQPNNCQVGQKRRDSQDHVCDKHDMNNLCNSKSMIDSYGALLAFEKSSTCGCKFDFSNISSMAWTVIIGDTLHNISDGLAIGAAFADMKTQGPSIGISTALAVFCHELPHELGDFAVLLQAGMSVKMAILFNFLSACSCYIGLVIGILIGQDVDIRYWIFAVTAGMFIYVALVDMLPELMHSDELHSEPLVTFLLQNLGIVCGFCLMILMARYEEQIAITL